MPTSRRWSSGELDIVPEFVGTLAYFLDPDADVTNDLDATLAVAAVAGRGAGHHAARPAPADSVNTFVVTQETADEYGLATVSDLASVDRAP